MYENVTADELVFDGDFSGLDVNYMTIGKSIKLTGKNTALNGVSFMINADNVTVDGFTLNQTDVYLFAAGGVKGITLSNNIINFKSLEGVDSQAIFASTVNGFNIVNNTINYVGTTDGTVVNNAIRVDGDEDAEVTSKNIVVENNIFNIELPSVDVYYDPDTWEAKVVSEGIVFFYCDDVKFNDNRVNIKYNKVSGYWDTIYGVSVRGNPYNFDAEDGIASSNVEILNNEINATGNNYLYTVYVSANNFTVDGNVINAAVDVHYANAINVDGPASHGIVSNNKIDVKSPEVVYGIYSYQYNGAIEDMVYFNNTIVGNAYATCAMEIVECNPIIAGNNIDAKGNYTFGIVASIRDDGVIANNTVASYGSNNGTTPTGDSLLPSDSLGVSVKGDASIGGNEIYSTGIGVNLVLDGDVTLYDNIIGVRTVGQVDSYAIYANQIDSLFVSDNIISFTGNTNGSTVNNAIRVNGDADYKVPAKNVTFIDNEIFIAMPSIDIVYDEYWNAHVMNEGIVFYYCDGLEFTNNDVGFTYTNASGYYDTIRVLSVVGDSSVYEFDDDYNLIYPIKASNIVIADNNITAVGHKYLYGVYVSTAEKVLIADNVINMTSDDYYAAGINLDGPVTSGAVNNNEINVNANGAVYGIYTGGYMGAVEGVTYDSNVIAANAYAACAMELVQADPYVSNNNISAFGNYSYGIVASMSGNGSFVDNLIFAYGLNNGSTPSGDSLLSLNTYGISVKGDALIDGNSIYATNIAVNLVEDGAFTITDNKIATQSIGLIDSYAIYANKLSDILISNNFIAFGGNTDGTVINNAIRVNGDDEKEKPAKNITVNNNTISIGIPSVDVVYDSMWKATAMSEGIVFYYCDDVEFTDNTVYLAYTNVSGSYDTIRVISVLGDAYNYDFDDDYNLIYPITASNIVIGNNNIHAYGHKYIYGVYVATADNISIIDNKIDITSDDYYAAGINLDGPASNGIVANNEINVTANSAVYGIYNGGYMGAVQNITNDGNVINAKAYAACAMELMENNPYVVNNIINAEGNYTYGIVASITDNGTIFNNQINVKGSEVGNQSTGDSILPLTTLGISVKGDAVIENNTVDATGIGIKTLQGEVVVYGNIVKTTGDYAIEATGTTLTVDKNYLSGKKAVGSKSIVSDKPANIGENTPALKVILAAPEVFGQYATGAIFTVMAMDENGDPIANLNLSTKLGAEVHNLTTDEKGFAEFIVDIDAGYYEAETTFEGNDVYGPKTITTPVTIQQSGTFVIAPESVSVYLIKVKTGYSVKITLTDIFQNGLANKTVNITFNGKTQSLVTDEAGVISYKLSGSKVGTQNLVINFTGDDNYVPSSATAAISMIKQKTKLTAVTKVSYKAKAKTKKYSVFLKDNKGKAIKNAKVSIKIRGLKTITLRTNSKGKVIFNLKKLTKKGTYTAKIKFATTKYYKASAATAKITLK